jgi:hypothetical protein
LDTQQTLKLPATASDSGGDPNNTSGILKNVEP